MLPSSGYNEALFHAACSYLTRGWSSIPVYGDADPERAKVSAVRWSAYQHSRPPTMEAHRWFMERRWGGVAIVTGRISGLAVLDFDDMQHFDEFQRDHPDLAETYRVETRRGVHLYFKVFPSVAVESRKAAGVDLQFEGRYVVASPTVIDGHRYQVIQEGAPKTICEADVQRLYAFLAATNQENAPTPVFVPSTGVSDSGQITGGDLVALYRHLAAKLGRNNALFRVSLRARDEGWQREAVVACLADLHAEQNSNCQHRNESHEQRYTEGVRTIASAFSRPARPRRDNSSYNNAQIPNSVREALFQLRQTYTIRVMEGLRLAGIQPGQTFTTTEALEILKGKVGRDTVYQALQATTVGGEFIFPRANPTPDNPTPATADIDRHKPHQKKCFSGREQKSGKRVFHRPARRFVMPDNLELGQKLGVNPSRSDPLTEDDLRSAKRTRQAAHRELIKRRPGVYPRRWLARRIGVTIRTLDAYNQAIPIQVRPMYTSVPISWTTLNYIPADFDLKGTFLQDETGKKYPPKQEIAARLLAKQHKVVYRRQTANFYSYGNDFPPDGPLPVMPRPELLGERAPTHVQRPLQEKLERMEASVRAQWAVNPLSAEQGEPPVVTCPPSATVPQEPPSTPAMPQQPFGQPARLERRSKRYYRRPLDDSRLEHIARQVHFETSANGQGMSLSNARRLLDTYGAQPVEFALKRMIWLHQKGKIKSPAGFLVVASRIAWRVQHDATELGTPAPRFRCEPVRKGVKRD